LLPVVRRETGTHCDLGRIGRGQEVGYERAHGQQFATTDVDSADTVVPINRSTFTLEGGLPGASEQF
jgi:hypothetical protein